MGTKTVIFKDLNYIKGEKEVYNNTISKHYISTLLTRAGFERHTWYIDVMLLWSNITEAVMISATEGE